MKYFILVLAFLSSFLLSSAQPTSFSKGVVAYKEGDYNKALEYFNADIEEDPQSSFSYLYRAFIYKYNDELSAALKDINSFLKTLSSKEKKALSSGYAFRASLYEKLENYEKASEDYAEAIKLNPDDIDLYISRANFYFNTDEFDKAEADYKKALEIDETSTQAYAGLSRNYISQKNYVAAKKTIDKLIKLSPKDVSGYFLYAWLSSAQELHDDAINSIFYALSLDLTNSTLRDQFYLYAKKNYSLAIAKVNSELVSNPESISWYNIRTTLYENSNNYAKAILDYNKLLTLVDEDEKSLYYYYRGFCYSHIDKLELAIEDYTRAINLDSTTAYVYSARGAVSELSGDFRGAKADFTKAILLDPQNFWNHFVMARLEEKHFGNKEAAMKEYNEALSLNKESIYALFYRGRLYSNKFNNKESAQRDYVRILDIDTVITESNNLRQFALLELGRKDEAIQWQSKILEKFPTAENYYFAAGLYALLENSKKSLDYLSLALDNGYRQYSFIEAEEDLRFINKLPEYKALMNSWRKKDDEYFQAELSIKKDLSEDSIQTVTIPMKPKGSGTYEVPCKINELPLNLIFDTGASDISISQTEVQFMLKNGYLKTSDITGTQRYIDANGDIELGTTIVFKKVDFGGVLLKNVRASVVNNKNAPLLFGQSALSKYGKITIDNIKKTITISRSSADR